MLNRKKLLALDVGLLRTLRTRGHTPALERAARVYSSAGEHGACWYVLGVAGATLAPDRQRRGAFVRGAAVTAGVYGLNYAIKLAVRRPRPQLDDLPPLSGVISRLSFPSAHASTSFAAAAMYSRVLPPAPLYAAAGLFALSRPYLGVHYPSDVLAGAVLGTLVAAASPH